VEEGSNFLGSKVGSTQHLRLSDQTSSSAKRSTKAILSTRIPYDSIPQSPFPISSSSTMSNPRSFLDFQVEGQALGRVIFELFADIVPKTVEKYVAPHFSPPRCR